MQDVAYYPWVTVEREVSGSEPSACVSAYTARQACIVEGGKYGDTRAVVSYLGISQYRKQGQRQNLHFPKKRVASEEED